MRAFGGRRCHSGSELPTSRLKKDACRAGAGPPGHKPPSRALAGLSGPYRSQAIGVHRRDPRLRRGRLWTKTNMTRLRGCAPKGQRLIDKVPHGRWKTATFLAAPCATTASMRPNIRRCRRRKRSHHRSIPARRMRRLCEKRRIRVKPNADRSSRTRSAFQIMSGAEETRARRHSAISARDQANPNETE
jgi:hypothetical protein